MIPTISMAEDKGIDWRIEAQSQAAGTPNQAGIGAFVPLGSEGFMIHVYVSSASEM